MLLCFGNYAGDVLHFGQAAGPLERQRHPRESRSRSPTTSPARGTDEIEKRRGIAGDLAVFKVAAAAADDGLLARRGVPRRLAAPTTAPARSAWPSPAAPCPAPTSRCSRCPQGRMAVGMGIHGEPGIGETDVPTRRRARRTAGDNPPAGRRAGRCRRRPRRPRRAHPQRAGHRQVRRAVRRLPPNRPTAAGRRASSPSSPRWANSSPASTWPASR